MKYGSTAGTGAAPEGVSRPATEQASELPRA
eukprot:CAMPEP_0179312350 /NCGR_PEP_ID=MMETSP0797-20121207/53210_1 /TAXON_ID=47934 /ORGANISM="Dinophysis acuminata, Strain DAEP01" /LENGTH=30 /DNA_ID= /DNA_START= /DNA_END= /DNA_ORIENTATION=